MPIADSLARDFITNATSPVPNIVEKSSKSEKMKRTIEDGDESLSISLLVSLTGFIHSALLIDQMVLSMHGNRNRFNSSA